MPIRINLLAEAQASEDLRRRDPVKRAIFGGALLVALSLVWYSSIWLRTKMEEQKLNQTQAMLGSHTNDYAQVQASSRKIAEMQQRIDALNQLNNTRFLYGNLLNALQQTYVTNVQLARLHVDQSYTATGGTPAKNGVPGRPATVTEHVTLTLEAKDSGPNPGDQVQHFKEALMAQDYLKTRIDPVTGIRLLNLSPVQSLGDSRPFVTFTLESRFVTKP